MSALAATAIPAVIAAGASAYGTYQSNKTNRQLAREQMQFQERMSNTSYQRTVEDMRKAGINPMLAAKLGGASTPPGASATAEDAIGPAINSALAVKRFQAESRKLDADTALARATAEMNASSAKKIQQDTEGNWFKNFIQGQGLKNVIHKINERGGTQHGVLGLFGLDKL